MYMQFKQSSSSKFIMKKLYLQLPPVPYRGNFKKNIFKLFLFLCLDIYLPIKYYEYIAPC